MTRRNSSTPATPPSDSWLWGLLASCFFTLGCGSPSSGDLDAATVEGDAGGEDGVDGSAATGPGPIPNRVGFINLIENSPYYENGFGLEAVRAELNDAPWLPHAERVASHGDCALFSHRPSGFCDPACGEKFCTADGDCVPYPYPVDAGEIEVTGLAAPLSFVSSETGYLPSYTDFGGEIFADAAEIVAIAAGNEIPGFTLRARGQPPIEADSFLLELFRDQEPLITWRSASAGRIQVALRHGWHGMAYDALLVCEVADTGEVAIPSAMVNAYVELVGSGEVNYWWITRFDRDVVTTSHGLVELFVGNFFYVPQML